MSKADLNYFNLINDILEHGVNKETRTGNVKSVFGRMLRFDLQNDGLPILTTKKMFVKGCIYELLWFLKGETNIKPLLLNDVHIWDDDAYRFYKEKVEKHNQICDFYEQKYQETKNSFYKNGDKKIQIISKDEFLKNVLDEKQIFLEEVPYFYDLRKTNYTFGDLGPVYGKQWRAFNNQIDQIKDLIDKLKTNPDDRRLLCISYNPTDIAKMALPPCHVMFQFYTEPMTMNERLNYAAENGLMLLDCDASSEQLDEMNVPKRKLSLMWTQRSVDVMLGLPFNILSYAIFTYIVAKICNMEVGDLIGSLGDCHIYENQMDGVNELLKRNPSLYTKNVLIKINDKVKNIDKIEFDDISIENYESYGKIHFPLSVG